MQGRRGSSGHWQNRTAALPHSGPGTTDSQGADEFLGCYATLGAKSLEFLGSTPAAWKVCAHSTNCLLGSGQGLTQRLVLGGRFSSVSGKAFLMGWWGRGSGSGAAVDSTRGHRLLRGPQWPAMLLLQGQGGPWGHRHQVGSGATGSSACPPEEFGPLMGPQKPGLWRDQRESWAKVQSSWRPGWNSC